MALHPTVERVVLHWGEMGARWGVNRTVSQIHALLYLSDRPLPADEIADSLGVARSNVSNSLKELQGWGLIKVVHVMGDRRDHFDSLQDITQLFRVIVEERKRRELDPTVALLRELADKEDAATPAHVRQKLKSTLSFLELLTRWYDDMKGLPHPIFLALLKMGGRIQRFLKAGG
ncbi:ArsR family transcriptional regulator [Betaproteobacteria bacterium GR16-43]|nr:ArsR family transcriptional regulator [Betaproteobacteria bacterium GR16-43]